MKNKKSYYVAEKPKRRAVVRFETSDGQTSTRRLYGRWDLDDKKEIVRAASGKLGGRRALFFREQANFLGGGFVRKFGVKVTLTIR